MSLHWPQFTETASGPSIEPSVYRRKAATNGRDGRTCVQPLFVSRRFIGKPPPGNIAGTAKKILRAKRAHEAMATVSVHDNRVHLRRHLLRFVDHVLGVLVKRLGPRREVPCQQSVCRTPVSLVHVLSFFAFRFVTLCGYGRREATLRHDIGVHNLSS